MFDAGLEAVIEITEGKGLEEILEFPRNRYMYQGENILNGFLFEIPMNPHPHSVVNFRRLKNEKE
ncbi:MAG: hypothetical protein ACTSVA_05650 [Candidatus Njordarchaeales archaeon]